MELIKLDRIEQVGIAVRLDAEQKRDALLTQSAEVKTVDDSNQQETAVDHMRRIKQMLNSTEDARTTVKRPVLDIGKRIDALAKAFCARLDDEFDRLSGLVNTFQAQERRRIENEEQKRQAEVERLRVEEEEARKRLAKAERQASRASAGLSEAEQAALAEHQVFEASKAVAVAAAAPPAEVQRTAGMVTRPVVEFEITDKTALYKLKPDWFDLVPRRSVIRAEVTKETKLLGLKVWETVKIGVRE